MVTPGRGQAGHGITMRGAPTTGKTTFLAALSIALIRRGSAWRVKGLDSESNELLIDLTVGLTKDQLFPDGTIGIAHYRWALDGKRQRRIRRWLFWRRQWRRTSGPSSTWSIRRAY